MSRASDLWSHELRGRLTSFGRAHHELRMEVLASVCDAPSPPDGSQEPADEALDVMRDDSRPAASPASPLAAAIAPDPTVPAAGGPAVGMSVERAAFSPLANGHAVPRSASKRALPPSSGADGASEAEAADDSMDLRCAAMLGAPNEKQEKAIVAAVLELFFMFGSDTHANTHFVRDPDANREPEAWLATCMSMLTLALHQAVSSKSDVRLQGMH